MGGTGESFYIVMELPMYKHFDDYWIDDTDAKYDAIDRLKKEFTAADYNKKYAK